MNKDMKKLLDKVNEAAAAKAGQISEVESRIATQLAIIDEARREAEEAFERVDTEAYHKAMEKMRAAQDTVHMLDRQLEKIKATPGMTADEYKETEKQIRDAFDKTYAEAMETAAGHVSTIAGLLPEVAETFAAGNTALHKLQYDVQGDVTTVTRQGGQKVVVNGGSFDKHIRDYNFAGDVIDFLYDDLKTDSERKDWA